MTERRCIAIGRGTKGESHFYLGDCDRKDIDLEKVKTGAPSALIIETHRGYHIISPEPITDPYVLSIVDEKCPGNAVRFDPHDDLILVRKATKLCLRVAKIYEMVFDGRVVTDAYLPCHQRLGFGIYKADKDGIKLHGIERTLEQRTKEESDQTQ